MSIYELNRMKKERIFVLNQIRSVTDPLILSELKDKIVDLEAEISSMETEIKWADSSKSLSKFRDYDD